MSRFHVRCMVGLSDCHARGRLWDCQAACKSLHLSGSRRFRPGEIGGREDEEQRLASNRRHPPTLPCPGSPSPSCPETRGGSSTRKRPGCTPPGRRGVGWSSEFSSVGLLDVSTMARAGLASLESPFTLIFVDSSSSDVLTTLRISSPVDLTRVAEACSDLIAGVFTSCTSLPSR